MIHSEYHLETVWAAYTVAVRIVEYRGLPDGTERKRIMWQEDFDSMLRGDAAASEWESDAIERARAAMQFGADSVDECRAGEAK